MLFWNKKNYRKQEYNITVIKTIVVISLLIIAIVVLSVFEIKRITDKNTDDTDSQKLSSMRDNDNLEGQDEENRQNESEVEATVPEDKVEENVSQGKLPNLTQEGIDNINNIYTNGEKIVYLTFDDGPSRTVTPLILDLLRDNNIKATFFVLGSRVGLSPDIVKRAYDEGHYIANHGYSHVYSKIYQSAEYVVEEYYQCEYEIRGAIENDDYVSHLFRFPGGSTGGKYAELKQLAAAYLLDNGSVHIDWNCLTDDSAGAKTREALLERLKVTAEGKNNLVILMHDAGDKILTYEMLQEAIDYLREQGYTFKNFYDVIK